MTNTNALLQKVVAVLDSDMTSYRIAELMGYKSTTYIDDLRKGRAKIENIKLANLEKFEEIYGTLI